MDKSCYINKGIILLFLCVILSGINPLTLIAQEQFIPTHEDSTALENVIVETYYVSDSTDYVDTTGGVLPKGSVTYRIYIDMKPGYALQMVYGDKIHELFIKTTTSFFNNLFCLAITGFNIHNKEVNMNSVALDSWITMGAATRLHTGILKSDDIDGSILKRPALSKADGLTDGVFPTFKAFNIDLDFFKNRKDASVFSTQNGAWYALEGVKGPDENNRVLIAQLTTNGKLSFDLNVQLRTITKGGWVKFVSHNPGKYEVQYKGLSFPSN